MIQQFSFKFSACNAGDLGLIPGWEDPLEKGTASYLLQYSGLENSMDCIVHGVAKSRTWLSDFHFPFLSFPDPVPSTQGYRRADSYPRRASWLHILLSACLWPWVPRTVCLLRSLQDPRCYSLASSPDAMLNGILSFWSGLENVFSPTQLKSPSEHS